MYSRRLCRTLHNDSNSRSSYPSVWQDILAQSINMTQVLLNVYYVFILKRKLHSCTEQSRQLQCTIVSKAGLPAN